MALVKVKDLLTHATKHHYGVPAINSINPETVRFAIEAAEHERLPIIVQYFPGFADYMPVNVMAFAACQYARNASVPVAVHLDHSKDMTSQLEAFAMDSLLSWLMDLLCRMKKTPN